MGTIRQVTQVEGIRLHKDQMGLFRELAQGGLEAVQEMLNEQPCTLRETPSTCPKGECGGCGFKPGAQNVGKQEIAGEKSSESKFKVDVQVGEKNV